MLETDFDAAAQADQKEDSLWSPATKEDPFRFDRWVLTSPSRDSARTSSAGNFAGVGAGAIVDCAPPAQPPWFDRPKDPQGLLQRIFAAPGANATEVISPQRPAHKRITFEAPPRVRHQSAVSIYSQQSEQRDHPSRVSQSKISHLMSSLWLNSTSESSNGERGREGKRDSTWTLEAVNT